MYTLFHFSRFYLYSSCTTRIMCAPNISYPGSIVQMLLFGDSKLIKDDKCCFIKGSGSDI